MDQLAFRPGRQELLIRVRERKVQLWDIKDGRLLREIAAPNPKSFAMEPAGQRVVTSSTGKLPRGTPLRMWNVDTGEELAAPPIAPLTSDLVSQPTRDEFSGPNLAWSPDGKVILMAHASIRAVDASSGAELWTRPVDDQYPFAPVFSPDGRAFAVVGFHRVHVYDFPLARGVRTLEGGELMLHRPVAWSADSTRLVTLSQSNTISVWDLADKPSERQEQRPKP